MVCCFVFSQTSVYGIPCEASAHSWEIDSGQARYQFNGLGRGVPSQLVSEQVVMADRRDWGGGGDDPEESTQRMIERIWESLTEIRMRMNQQTLVPLVVGEAVPVAPVPPPPGVEVPFVAPVPPSPPVIATEEPVVQVERFLRLQPPTYTGGPNPDTAEHWIHEIDRQAKREQFRTLQQGETSVLEYQMRLMALSRYAPYVVMDNAMMVEYFIRGLRLDLQTTVIPLMCRTVEEAAQRVATLERVVRTRQAGESGSGSFQLPQQSVGVSKGKASVGPSSSGFGKWGKKLKQAFKGKRRGWGGRQQVQ
ncbi:hypothetical protein Taro_030504 [Colocasia esculenta]|uniref:Retrotransposon gag domain-containing protein n=1 Tax=Colocasia esculenta TaxID=4460 RepID=A0A843VGH2_COLES|nr:hypothetical protein [Colocasia esculenta]